MLYGCDSAYPPKTVAAARKIFSAGWQFYGGYIGGPRALNAWSNADFGRLAKAGFVFVLYYVGRNTPWDDAEAFTFDQGLADGDDANRLAGACGFNENQPICLDAEYGTWQAMSQRALDYFDGWCQRIHDAGHATILYSDGATIDAAGSHFDYVMGAYYTRTANNARYATPPVGQYDPSQPPPWTFWQFSDTGIGGTVDCISAVEGAPLAGYTPPAG